MANATILRSRTHRIRDGYIYEGVGAFPTTALTCTLPIKNSGTRIRDVVAQAMGTSGAASTSYRELPAGATVSASAKFSQFAPFSGSISSVSFVVTTTVATDAANIWTIGVLNKTTTLTPVDIADPLNSNTTTTGAAFTAYTERALTLGAAAQLLVVTNDVLEWTFTKASSAANLVGLTMKIGYTPTGGGAPTESVYGPAPNASGYYDLTSGALTITRTAVSATSALKFRFRIEMGI